MKTLWCIQNECGELTAPYEAALHAQDGLHCLVLILPDGDHLTVSRDKCLPTAFAAWTAYQESLKDEIDHLMVEFVNAGIKIKELSTAQPESEKI